MTPEQQIELQLRQIALDAAIRAGTNDVVSRAQAFYKFLKGEPKDG